MNMRTIEPVEGGFTIATERGPVPELRWLAISDLVVDDAYQRPIAAQGLKTIRGIVEAFDWRMFAPVVVCPIEGGLYAIVDGQHRTTAALTCGIERVPALIIQADRTMQAKAFGAINGQVTKIMSTALYKARLAADDPLAARLQAVTDAADVRLLTYHPSWKEIRPGETTAFGSLERALKAHGDAALTLCLKALRAAAGDDPGVIGAATIGAFVNVLTVHKEFLRHRDLVPASSRYRLRRKLDIAIEEAGRRRISRQLLLESSLVTFLTREIENEDRFRSPKSSSDARA